LNGVRTVPPAPGYALSAKVSTFALLERGDDAVGAGGGQVVCGAGQSCGGPDQPAGRVGDDLDVYTVASVFSGVVRLLIGDPVDRDQRAVDDAYASERILPIAVGRSSAALVSRSTASRT
jgi:hypothetical protein